MTNDIRSLGTKLRVLNLNGNKLRCYYSKGILLQLSQDLKIYINVQRFRDKYINIKDWKLCILKIGYFFNINVFIISWSLENKNNLWCFHHQPGPHSKQATKGSKHTYGDKASPFPKKKNPNYIFPTNLQMKILSWAVIFWGAVKESGVGKDVGIWVLIIVF